MNNKKYDAIIIGGGFYGCMIAANLRTYCDSVLIIEKEDQLLTKASYNNQARIHNGYHYPRSFVTGLRSHVNYKKFAHEFKSAVCDSYTMVYAIAKNSSKTTSGQFIKFCSQIGASLKEVSAQNSKIFDQDYVEGVFEVEEAAFNAAIVRSTMEKLLHTLKVDVVYNTQVSSVKKGDKGVCVQLENGDSIIGGDVYLTAYAGINTILQNSALPPLPFKHEYVEMPLVEMPGELKKMGITIMDGPFFSLMPFPDRKLHSFHHVRYTPHFAWTSESESLPNMQALKSKFIFMQKDAQRYIPELKKLQYVDSLYEVKTVLTQNEMNDGRPILFGRNYGMQHFHPILGGKIDNIYDVLTEIERDRNYGL